MTDLGWKYLTDGDKANILRGMRDGVAHGGPYHVEIYPADRCNIECFFCSTAAIRGTDELPLTRLEQLLGELKAEFTAEDRYLGRAIAFRIDRFVIAFSGFGDRQKLTDLCIATDQRIIGTIRKQLVNADKAVEQAASKNPAASTTTRPPWAP